MIQNRGLRQILVADTSVLVDINGEPSSDPFESILCLRGGVERDRVLSSIMDGTIGHTIADTHLDLHDNDVDIARALGMATINEHHLANTKMARVRALLLHAEVIGDDNPSEILRQLQSVVGGVSSDDDDQMNDAVDDVLSWDEPIVDEVDPDKTANVSDREDGKNRMSTKKLTFSDVPCGDNVIKFGGADEQKANTNDVNCKDIVDQVEREAALLMLDLLVTFDS
jgi:hypothetical protein